MFMRISRSTNVNSVIKSLFIREMSEHIKSTHDKIKDHKCDSYEQTFSQKSNLKRHIATIHETKREFSCDVCGKDFSSNSNLKIHIQEVHMKIKKNLKSEEKQSSSQNPHTIMEWKGESLDRIVPKLEITENKCFVKCELSEDYFSKDN